MDAREELDFRDEMAKIIDQCLWGCEDAGFTKADTIDILKEILEQAAIEEERERLGPKGRFEADRQAALDALRSIAVTLQECEELVRELKCQ